MHSEVFLATFTRWAALQADIAAAALVGSYARGTQHAASDIDLVILSDNSTKYFADRSWLAQFGELKQCALEDWGAVTSLRVHYNEGPEVEFSFAHPAWAAMPVDPGTAEVLAGGMEVLLDPHNILAALQGSVGRG